MAAICVYCSSSTTIEGPSHDGQACLAARCVFGAGAHRRIDQGEIERALGADSRRNLSRAEERSLWLHRALLARLMVEPDEVLAVGRANLERLRQVHDKRGITARWLASWEQALSEGVDAVAEVATSLSPLARELRQNSPFAGVISQDTRSKVLTAFARHWRTEHVA